MYIAFISVQQFHTWMYSKHLVTIELKMYQMNGMICFEGV